MSASWILFPERKRICRLTHLVAMYLNTVFSWSSLRDSTSMLSKLAQEVIFRRMRPCSSYFWISVERSILLFSKV